MYTFSKMVTDSDIKACSQCNNNNNDIEIIILITGLTFQYLSISHSIPCSTT